MQKKQKEATKNYFSDFVLFKEERARKFTTLVLTLVALSIFGLFAINPTASTIAELRKKIDDSTFVLNQMKAKETTLNELGIKYQQLQPDIHYIDSAIPNNANVPEVIGQAQRIAQDSSISIQNIQAYQVELSTESNVVQNGSFAFSISATGTYDNIQKFLNSLVYMDRIVTIESLSMAKGSTDPNTISFSVRGNAYFTR